MDVKPSKLLMMLALTLCAAGPAMGVPSTFNSTIGRRLLCLDQQDTAYYFGYLTEAFGPSYKHEGGAYWFKAGATLWGVQVSEVMVSDGDSTMTFLAAVADLPPDKLEEAIAASTGLHHRTADASKYPVRESSTGSRIVYFNGKAKIYCGKSRYLFPQ